LGAATGRPARVFCKKQCHEEIKTNTTLGEGSFFEGFWDLFLFLLCFSPPHMARAGHATGFAYPVLRPSFTLQYRCKTGYKLVVSLFLLGLPHTELHLKVSVQIFYISFALTTLRVAPGVLYLLQV